MFYGNTIEDTRQMFYTSWLKYLQKKPLLPLEEQIAAVILEHPEYHALLEKKPGDMPFFPELGQSNPFLHLGLHLAIRDQIATDRPQGIKDIFQKLQIRYTDFHDLEHKLMELLAECLWQAQRLQQMPDEIAFLQACSAL
ncbi:DUF1841 family protein [Legionella londiniensis]|uniref:DUF1841 domain-containing protein n=2 Tax=Legionella londiniensis TaxID=45068 RepID=A0A0W0VI20_9GAMM|nr:DUF1841 family protein [Legionella londiniensis]KTD19776.1 hypothetical protein Llon_1948 [Legionella londiniensis]STX92313.1 Domain of uncharacterised function (DUF1841) [Legionella londiniensis]